MYQVHPSNRKRVSAAEVKIIQNDYKKKCALLQQQQQQIQRNKTQGNDNNNNNNNNSSSRNEKFDDCLKWTTCYSDDIYEYWKSGELARPFLDLSSNFFTWRPNQISALKYLVRKFNFNNLTLHLAIHILDTYLCHHQITQDERKLAVIACFVVAAKVEEYEPKIPNLAQLNQAMMKIKKHGRFYTLEEFQNFEVRILRCIQFKLTIPTVATFANYFSKITVTMEEFQVFNQKITANVADNGFHNSFSLFNSHQHMLTSVNGLLFRLVDMSSDIIYLRNILPSQMAAACVFAARCLNNIIPNWTTALETLTQYDESELISITRTIIGVYTRELLT